MNQMINGVTISECGASDKLEDCVPVDAGQADEPESPCRPLSAIYSMDGYLQSFGRALGKKAVTSLKPLHVPNVTELPDFDDVLETASPLDLFDAQKHVVGAGVELFNKNGSGFLCGEMGVGKTVLSALSAFKHAKQPRSRGGRGGKFRCLVLCPDHLIAKWKREIEKWIPDAKVYYFGSLSEAESKSRKKEDGKTGQQPAINDLINLLDNGTDVNKKGTGFNPGDTTRRRWRKPDGPEYYVIGRNQVKWFPKWLGLSDPYKGFNAVGGLLGGNTKVVKLGESEDGAPVTGVIQSYGVQTGKMVEKPTSSRTIVVDRVMAKDDDGYPIRDANGNAKHMNVTARVFCCPKCGNVIRDKKGVPVSANVLGKNKTICEGKYLQQLPSVDPTKQNGLDMISPLPEKFKDRTSGVVTIGEHKYKVMTCGERLWWFTSKPYRFSLARIIQKKFRRFFDYCIIDECHEQQSDESAQSMAAGKLIGAIPHVMALTGTLIGGYAKDLFALLLRICPDTLVREGFEWGKNTKFSEVYGRIDKITTTKEDPGAAKGVSKSIASMRRAKTGAAKPRSVVRPGIMPTMFGRHMIGNTMFLALDEMAEGLPDMFEYIGGECPPEPEPTGNDEADQFEMDRYERMKSFWVDTACAMHERQKAEYDRIETALNFAAKELLKRGSMKLLGTMLATTMGWPDYCHDEWAMDDDLVKSLKESEGDPAQQAPALLGQAFLKNFDYRFEAETETLVLKKKGSGEEDRIQLVKDGGVFWLDATFNNGKTRRLVYDTGASSVSLPIMMANELGLAPTSADKVVLTQVADGRIVKCRSKTIESVRVGKSIATDVEATIKMAGSDLLTVGYWDKPDDKTVNNWKGVVTPKSLDATEVYPKERRLIDICKLHKKADNQVWVYCQMTGKRDVQPRLKRVLEREGLRVGILRSGDVDPKEREAWIAEHGRQFDVMICFPKLVSTGLDLFSKVQGGHNFNCIVFYETGYKLNDMRQAARRAWRIGQPKDCFIYYLYYQGTMQHRAMSLMSKKMSAALALEGEFSEEGLAAMAGEGDEQMALAKSMSEKIDDADMQRNWAKVKSMADKKKPSKKKPVESIADLTKELKPSPLDSLSDEEQLMAATILENQSQPVPESAKPDIEDLAGRFEADTMNPIEALFAAQAERRKADGEPAYQADESAKAYAEDFENRMIYSAEPGDMDAALEEMIVNPTEPEKSGWDLVTSRPAKLKVHKPEPEPAPTPKSTDPFDDIAFDDALIAKMMANMAKHGMTAEDIFG